MPAFLFVTFAGRYTDDETWDWVTGSGMAILTFLTAPWVVELIYQVLTRRRPLRFEQLVLRRLSAVARWGVHATVGRESDVVALHLCGGGNVVES